MIFILTILICCGRYLFKTSAVFNSEDAIERPWAYDHTARIGASIGFIFALFQGAFYGVIGEAIYWIGSLAFGVLLSGTI